MKKIPSYPKFTTNTNITVTQTQKININSPKAFANSKKMFKVPNKLNERPQTAQTSKSTQKLIPKPSQSRLEKPYSNSRRKSSGHKNKVKLNLSELQKHQKSQKHQRQQAQSREQLKKLEQKLKLLQNKINTLKSQKRKQSVSNRSHTKDKQKSIITNSKSSVFYWKKQTNKQKKILKKSHSDKGNLRMSNFAHGKSGMNSQTPKNKANNSKVESEERQAELIHKFVTQVPQSSMNFPPKSSKAKSKAKEDQSLKDSVTQSLRKNIHFSSQQKQHGLYYIQNALKALVNPSLHHIRQHIVQSIQTLNFLQNVRKPHMNQLHPHCVQLPSTNHQYCIVLDLDQTLIHCNESIHVKHDVSLSIKFPTGQKIQAGVNVRPYAFEFIKQVSKFAQVIVFTASHQCYANVVLDHLDPQRKYISHRLFRDHCWQTQEGIYIKDLRVLGNRSLKNMLLVDNAAYSYFFQLQNGVPIIPYYEDKSDVELVTLLHYIKRLISINKNEKQSLNKINHHFFKLNNYVKFDDIGLLVRSLYQETVLGYKESMQNLKSA